MFLKENVSVNKGHVSVPGGTCKCPWRDMRRDMQISLEGHGNGPGGTFKCSWRDMQVYLEGHASVPGGIFNCP